jgi:formylglycine-generating enzyme required for sulfatase activity
MKTLKYLPQPTQLFRLALALALAAPGLIPSRTLAAITVDTVLVGNAGNANDGTGYGAVAYDYHIGKYEVTLNQYSAFLNAVAATDTYALYNPNLGTDLNSAGIARSGASGSYSYSVIGSGDRPVTYVSWFDAARFANWLHNGQPTGQQDATTTENGAYALLGATSGVGFSRNSEAMFWIPGESEWYKAAHHQPAAQGGDADDYWLYPTANNTIPNSRNGSNDDPNSANFYLDDGLANGFNGGFATSDSTVFSASQDYLTDAGAYALAASYYGTFDQGGNVWEWNEEVSGSGRILRGGSWNNNEVFLRSSSGNTLVPTLEFDDVGFRIASNVPEPAVGVLMALGIGFFAWRRLLKR